MWTLLYVVSYFSFCVRFIHLVPFPMLKLMIFLFYAWQESNTIDKAFLDILLYPQFAIWSHLVEDINWTILHTFDWNGNSLVFPSSLQKNKNSDRVSKCPSPLERSWSRKFYVVVCVHLDLRLSLLLAKLLQSNCVMCSVLTKSTQRNHR